jgi:hypothetical protein
MIKTSLSLSDGILMAALLTCMLLFSPARIGHAHDIAGPIDPAGNVASFTAVALVTCFNDGNGVADNLIANIRDLPSNPAVEGMFVNLTLFKGSMAISTTDITPGDNNPSPAVKLSAGTGAYFMIVSKTKPGARNIAIEYHCMTQDNVHTGTGIDLVHYQ